MYRYIRPDAAQEMPLRMLFQPAGDNVFFKACEADSWRGLVAALLDDPAYETADLETRLVHRLRPADDVALLAQVNGRRLQIKDRDGPDTINISSDQPFVRSLQGLGFVSVERTLAQNAGEPR